MKLLTMAKLFVDSYLIYGGSLFPESVKFLSKSFGLTKKTEGLYSCIKG